MEAAGASVLVGNAWADAPQHRGWLLGHFVEPPGSLRRTADVEVKWDAHAKGEHRSEPVDADDRTAVCVLLRGRLRVAFPGRDDVVLAEEGDYVVWHRIGHTWSVEEECVAVVVRWPSVPGYA